MHRAKKLLLQGLILLYSTSVQAAPEETIRLKSGGFIKGEIIELQPNELIVIRTPTGEIRKFTWSEVVEPGATTTPVAQPPQSTEEEATIIVRSTGKPATLGKVEDQFEGAAASVGGTAAVWGIRWVDLCRTPCETKVKPGLTKLRLSGDGVYPAMSEFQLKPGPNYLTAKPGSLPLWVLSATALASGIMATVAGGIVWGIGREGSDEVTYGRPITLIGLGLLIGGAVGMASNTSSLKEAPAPLPAPKAARGISFSGQF